MKKIICVITVIIMAASLMQPVSARTENLISGLICTVETGAANSHSYEKGGDPDVSLLTDGERGDPSDFYGGKWAHFNRGTERTLTYDLGSVRAIGGYRADFIQYAPYGIYAPAYFTCLVSADGVNYSEISGAEPPYHQNYGEKIVRASYTDSFDAYAARYVRFVFDVSVNLFCDEIELYGGDADGGEKALPAPSVEDTEAYFCPRDKIGVHDIACFHYGYSSEGTKNTDNPAESFLPYIAYTDKDGRIVDTMFDAIMFFTLMGNCPSGGKMTEDGPISKLSDWEYLIGNCFGDSINLNALEDAAGQVKEALGLPDYRVAVYLSIPVPKLQSDFGDINGDGVSESIENVGDMLAAAEWYIDTVIEKYNSYDYKNIEFKGIFWSSESICGIYSENDFEYTERCIDMLRTKGLQVVYIPLYQGNGIQLADKYRFDAVTMQPNLSFDKTLQEDPEGMMADFAETAGKYHLGMEMEINDGYLWDRDKWGGYFETYLRTAVRSGLMDSVHTYYQGAGPGTFYSLAMSSDSYDRYLYDCLYKFTKGTLSFPDDPAVTPTATIELKGISGFGTVECEGDYRPSEYIYEVTRQPEYGTVRVFSATGKYLYMKKDGFAGGDSFEISVTFGGKTTAVAVSVTGASEGQAESSLSEESASADDTPEKGGFGGWIYAVAGAAAAISAAAVLILIRRKKKNG